MQNYAYDRNYSRYNSRYNKVSGYRRNVRYSSVSRTFRLARKILAAVLLLLIDALVSDKAVAVYKGVAGCGATIFLIGVVGGIETGSLPIALGFMLAFSALGFVIYKLSDKASDL